MLALTLPPPQALLIKAVIGAGVNLGMRGRFKHLRERRGGASSRLRINPFVCNFIKNVYERNMRYQVYLPSGSKTSLKPVFLARSDFSLIV